MAEAPKKKVTLLVNAEWEDGVFKCPDLNVSNETTEILTTHGPLLLAAASFSQLFVVKAAEDSISLNSLQVTATSDVNFGAFYREDHDYEATEPWKHIDLKVVVDTEDASRSTLEYLAEDVQRLCPSKELLKEHFEVDVGIVVDTVEDPLPKKISEFEGFNLDKYNDIAKGSAPIIFKHSLTCTYDKSGDLPCFQIEVDGYKFPISATETVPMGETPDGHPTAVQAFLFGSLALYMKTFAMRLAVKDYSIKTFKAFLKTTMNNGIKDYDDGLDPLVFDVWGGKIHLDIVSDAPSGAINKAFMDAQSMAPCYLLLARDTEIDVTVEKL